jgi:cation diffusion facilitator CzcD-associated flavoprotein CzcO
MNAPFRHVGADLDVAILGAGFSGLGMAIQLKRAGYKSFRIFEKASELGGTWRDNIYPGCACDVPSHLYSFSFDQNPDWSRSYSPQAEIWDYMKDVAARHGLLPYMRFNAPVSAIEYDDIAQVWHLSLPDGERVSARAVVSGVGALHLPATPEIQGLSNFKGAKFHSAQWDTSCDFAGKRVAVIGTGASAIQIVPALQPEVKELFLFQRTPAWILPRNDRTYSHATKWLFHTFPALQRAYRDLIYWIMESRALGFLVNQKIMKQAEKLALKYMEETLPDPQLRKAMTPNYTIGCKRILISDDFYQAVAKENVELVTQPVADVTADGIRTKDGKERKLDAIVFATGFRATDWLSHLRVVGKGGRVLSEDWTNGAEAYYGITVSGYPNFFILLGPNTGLGHNSIIFMIEAQVRYTMDCLNWLLREGAGEVEVKEDVQRAFNEKLKADLARTVWQSGCKSWYLNENGTNSTIWPGFTVSYWWQIRHAQREDFNVRPVHIPATVA